MNLVILRYASYLCAIGFGVFGYTSVRQAAARLRKRTTSGIAPKEGTSLIQAYFNEILGNGIAISMPMASMLESSSFASSFSRKAAAELMQMGCKTTPRAFLSITIFASICAGALLWALTGSLALGAALTACVPFLFSKIIEIKKERELAKLKTSLPEVIALFERCATAGNTLQQMFAEAAKESEGNLKAMFSKISLDLQVGGSIESALDYFHHEAPVDELAFLAIALSIQHQTGGSLAHILQSAAQTAQAKIELERKLQTQTAQARLSLRIVSLLPFLLLIALSILSPGFTDPFFSSAAGMGILCLALLMQGAGIFATKRILKGAR